MWGSIPLQWWHRDFAAHNEGRWRRAIWPPSCPHTNGIFVVCPQDLENDDEVFFVTWISQKVHQRDGIVEAESPPEEDRNSKKVVMSADNTVGGFALPKYRNWEHISFNAGAALHGITGRRYHGG